MIYYIQEEKKEVKNMFFPEMVSAIANRRVSFQSMNNYITFCHWAGIAISLENIFDSYSNMELLEDWNTRHWNIIGKKAKQWENI